jgi:glycosyltransferase involved in cell wall biosynthesis
VLWFDGVLTLKVDVAIITKDSQRMLRKCLDSVYANVPINNLIVVDGYSTDNTKLIFEEFHQKFGNVIFIQEHGTRASARQRAIQHVKTDWFMFVDSDVVLSKNWFQKAQAQIKEDVGGIWGIEVWSVIKGSKIRSLFERFTLKIFEKRGGTHDLLVRKKLVEDIQIPYELHTYEDAYIKNWINKKGFKVLGLYEPYCIHYRPESVWTMKKHISLVVSDLKFAAKSPALMLSYCFYAVIVAFQIVKKR